MGQNNIRKYLLYALGEIVLVVAGILFALAIDNANDQRALRQKEHTYLKGLHAEFSISRQKLQTLIGVNEKNCEGARKILYLMDNPAMLNEEKELSTILYQTFQYDLAFNPNNSLLMEMINSGSLKDLSNPELRKELTNWIASIEDIALQEKDLGQQREKVFDMFRNQKLSIKTILHHAGVLKRELDLSLHSDHHSNLQILDSQAFENNVLMFLTTSIATDRAHYQPLLKELNHIIDHIETALP